MAASGRPVWKWKPLLGSVATSAYSARTASRNCVTLRLMGQAPGPAWCSWADGVATVLLTMILLAGGGRCLSSGRSGSVRELDADGHGVADDVEHGRGALHVVAQLVELLARGVGLDAVGQRDVAET